MGDLMGEAGVPPGWYADPYGRAIQRYFNGSSWTAYVIDAAGTQHVDQPQGAVIAAPALPNASAGQGAIVIQNVIGVPQPQQQPMVAVNLGSGPMAKSPGTATLLAFLFGPLGLLYVNVGMAIALTVASVLLVWTVIVPIGIWIGGMVYANNEAQRHNQRLLGAAVAPQPIYGASQPPAQWQVPPAAALPQPGHQWQAPQPPLRPVDQP